MSVSSDGAATWTPAVTVGPQHNVQETNYDVAVSNNVVAAVWENLEPWPGIYLNYSWDEGETWPVKRVVSNVKTGSKKYIAGPWNREITLDATHGQNKSYWAATQTPDGIVHLNDSRLHYSFNLAWLISGF